MTPPTAAPPTVPAALPPVSTAPATPPTAAPAAVLLSRVLILPHAPSDNAAMAMGNFGGYPPLLAAWAPFMLFLLVGELVLIRTEE